MTDTNEESAASAVLALTREIPNYAEQLAVALGIPITELWSVVLAATGRMAYVDAEPHVDVRTRLGVVDARLRDGASRLKLWQDALGMVVDILGDPEARYRTGFDTEDLRVAIDAFFES